MMNRRRIIRTGFWIALAVVVVVVIVAIADGGGSSSDTTAAKIVTLEELREEANSEGKPIYWAGAQPDTELELSRPDQGKTYVRYLTGGAEAGTKDTAFLTIGTYDFPGAAAALEELSKKPGGVGAATAGGGVIYFDRARPQNVYLAYPGVDIEIEVYDPNAKQALGLVASGQIVPVG